MIMMQLRNVGASLFYSESRKYCGNKKTRYGYIMITYSASV